VRMAKLWHREERGEEEVLPCNNMAESPSTPCSLCTSDISSYHPGLEAHGGSSSEKGAPRGESGRRSRTHQEKAHAN
jgi:hypothetical protein